MISCFAKKEDVNLNKLEGLLNEIDLNKKEESND